MAKAPKKRAPKDEDEAQSQRFFALAADLEAAGELSPTDDGAAFNALIEKSLPARRKLSP